MSAMAQPPSSAHEAEHEALTHAPVRSLPPGWTSRGPEEHDIPRLARLVAQCQQRAIGSGSPDLDSTLNQVIGTASWTRRQKVAVAPDGEVRGWVTVYDRAAGRTMVAVDVDRDLPEADDVAGALFAWAEMAGSELAAEKGLDGTQLDSGAFAPDEQQRRWLIGAGYRQVRTWLQMTRPVEPADGEDGTLPPPRDGVVVRHVVAHSNGLPDAADLRAVHRVLEESFEDHFNSYRESFPEFVQRLREDPGHRWDHWWLALVDIDGEWVPGGAIVCTLSGPDDGDRYGMYVEYIGVHQRSRGRGVAKALLYTAIGAAAQRGRNRVTLEVDDDSPTHADELYKSLGWETMYATESWHRDIGAAPLG